MAKERGASRGRVASPRKVGRDGAWITREGAPRGTVTHKGRSRRERVAGRQERSLRVRHSAVDRSNR